MVIKRFTPLESALSCFSDELGYGVVREEIELEQQRDDVEYFLEFLEPPENSHFIEKEQLKFDIVEAFTRDDGFWVALNDYPIPEGYHITATELWWGVFPNDDPSDLIARGEDDYGEYHFNMLKFMVKKLIWDTLWLGEDIPNYQEPENGILPVVEDNKV